MRLAKITACGFKSFADKTVIAFDKPITGIVGPNGCGKSNIVDAIRWVLGTQSAKSLRGGAMMDIIFNGSSTRKPAGMASVTLTFENKDRTLPVEQDMVAVTRQLYRDGTSEYLINRQRCRLRDVKELFMDTGIGTDAYSIIEQGKVARMLESNAQERRQIFEEAAGISRFKARKKEATRKLERTEQNLKLTRTRLNDIERRLRSVKMQAGRARTYKQYSTRLKELQLMYALADYHRLYSQLDQVQHQLREGQDSRNQAVARLAEHEEQVASVHSRRNQLIQKQRQIEHERVGARSLCDQAKQRGEFAGHSLTELEARIQQDGGRLEGLAGQVAQLAKDLADHHDELTSMNASSEQAMESLETAERAHRESQHQHNQKQIHLEDERAGIIDLMRSTSQLRNQISALDTFKDNLEQSRDKLGKRANQVGQELEGLLTMRDSVTQQHGQAQQIIEQQRAKLDQIKEQISRLDQQQGHQAQELGTMRERRASLESRRSLLQEMQDSQQGLSDPVKALLARKAADLEGAPDADGSGKREFGFVRGAIAELFEADVENAALIEAALGDFQQAVITESTAAMLDHHKDVIEALAGRVTFVGIDEFKLPANADQKAPQGLKSVIELVRYPQWAGPVAWGLLGRTYLTADLHSAQRHRQAMPSGCRFVTMSCELLEADGRITAGPQGSCESATGGLIARRSELSQLHGQLSELDQAIDDQNDELCDLSDRAGHLSQLDQELRQAAYEANTARVELSSRLESVNDQISRLEREQPVIAAETEQIHQQMLDADRKRSDHADEAHQLEADSSQRQEAVAQLEHQISELSASAEAARERVTCARVELTRIAEQMASLERQIRQAQIARADVQRQVGVLEQQIAGHQERKEQLQDVVAESQKQTLAAAAQLDQFEAAVQDVAKQLSAMDAQMDQLHAAAAEHRRALEQIDCNLHEQQIAQREFEVKIEAVSIRTDEQLGLDVVAAYQQVLATGTAGPTNGQSDEGRQGDTDLDDNDLGESDTGNGRLTQMALEGSDEESSQPEAEAADPFDIDWDGVETEIATLRDKLGRIGNVNLGAIDEQDQLEQQHEEMGDQVRDIEQAAENLQKLIRQINDDSRKRFEKMFEQVRDTFAGQDGLFRKLFGGGRADLFLQPDEHGKIDVLESGIEIIAKPPGKEPQSISLLSGGEKTMTAVALLLSIFKTRPSPFAILDEVDAALDEANVHRFAQIIRSFLDKSHFIVITHNKGTMQVCDVLYGITMQERGVSKRVSVQFDQIGTGGQIDRKAIEEQNRRDAADARAEAKAAERTPERQAEEKPELLQAAVEAPEFEINQTPERIGDGASSGNGNGGNGESKKPVVEVNLASPLVPAENGNGNGNGNGKKRKKKAEVVVKTHRPPAGNGSGNGNAGGEGNSVLVAPPGAADSSGNGDSVTEKGEVDGQEISTTPGQRQRLAAIFDQGTD